MHGLEKLGLNKGVFARVDFGRRQRFAGLEGESLENDARFGFLVPPNFDFLDRKPISGNGPGRARAKERIEQDEEQVSRHRSQCSLEECSRF